MLNKLVLSLSISRKIDVDKFFDTVITQVQGRYGGDLYFTDLAKPTCHLIDNSVSNESRNCYFFYDIYEIDANELEPAVISVLAEFKKFSNFDFTFQLNGKNIDDQNFWRISSDEMFGAGHNYGFEDVDDYGKVYYDATAARYAADIYFDKIAAFNSVNSKTA